MVNEAQTHRREGGFVGRTPASRPSWALRWFRSLTHRRHATFHELCLRLGVKDHVITFKNIAQRPH